MIKIMVLSIMAILAFLLFLSGIYQMMWHGNSGAFLASSLITIMMAYMITSALDSK